MVRQVSVPCPTCGSYYRDENKCNICGTVNEVQEKDDHIVMHHENKGRQWSKKLHRYLTQKEISQGMRGY
jgi:hypothetical protein